jgi:hypothetical protein
MDGWTTSLDLRCGSVCVVPDGYEQVNARALRVLNTNFDLAGVI